MKRILNLIFSTKATIVLLAIFAVSIGTATFIEDKYDTVTAKLMIYNARWFELIYLLLVLNFIGNIKRYNLLSWKKASTLLFHLAFIVLIIGAGITRYFGISGIMRSGKVNHPILFILQILIYKYMQPVRTGHIPLTKRCT